MSETIRVSKTVAITIAISTDTRATMSVDMCSRFLTVDKNGLVKPMFVESVFPRDRLQVLHSEVLLTAFHGCILRGLVHTNTCCSLLAFRIRMSLRPNCKPTRAKLELQ